MIVANYHKSPSLRCFHEDVPSTVGTSDYNIILEFTFMTCGPVWKAYFKGNPDDIGVGNGPKIAIYELLRARVENPCRTVADGWIMNYFERSEEEDAERFHERHLGRHWHFRLKQPDPRGDAPYLAELSKLGVDL